MKKRIIALLLASSLMGTTIGLTACGDNTQQASSNTCGCNCNGNGGCGCCCCNQNGQAAVPTTTESEALAAETQATQQAMSETEQTQTQIDVEQQTTDETKPVSELSEEEKAARKEAQAQLAAQREEIYSMPDSLEKTQKINEIDKQILANNSFDFSEKTIQFMGDSITSAICGDTDENGVAISYTDYADDYLHFANCMNNGMAGRMFADYGGEELSFSLNMGNVLNNSANISVVFLGVNDYLSGQQNKRYGNMNDTESTAGYIGALRYTMKQLKANYPNQEFFFVTMYNISKTAESTYTDVATPPTLADYMETQRQIVESNGYHIIELYNTGFMDANDAATSSTYLADGLHPNNAGNIILGEHIAAELSLYYSQR